MANRPLRIVKRTRRIGVRQGKVGLDGLREGKGALLATQRLARSHEQAYERHHQREGARPREQLASRTLDEV